MILAFLTARWAAFQGLPPLMRRLIAGVVLVALLWLLWAIWLGKHDRKVIAEHEAEVTQEIVKASQQATVKASEAVATAKDKTEQSNAQARAAASRSDDPLRAAFDSLRNGQR